jgi:hypothetical protein
MKTLLPKDRIRREKARLAAYKNAYPATKYRNQLSPHLLVQDEYALLVLATAGEHDTVPRELLREVMLTGAQLPRYARVILVEACEGDHTQFEGDYVPTLQQQSRLLVAYEGLSTLPDSTLLFGPLYQELLGEYTLRPVEPTTRYDVACALFEKICTLWEEFGRSESTWEAYCHFLRCARDTTPGLQSYDTAADTIRALARSRHQLYPCTTPRPTYTTK